MRCLLIAPPLFSDGEKTHPRHPPHMLAYTAAMLEKNNVDVEIIDAFLLNMTLNEIIREVKRRNPDLVGIAPYDYTRETPIEISHELARLTKSISPEVRAGLLGSHDKNFFISQLKQNPSLDYVVLGESELTMVDLCKTSGESEKNLTSIKGLAFRVDGEVVINEERESIKDLDRIPYPAWHLLPLDKYMFIPHRYKHRPFIPMLASRGCPYKCKFCKEITYSRTRKYRTRSVRNVIDEIKYLMREYKVKEIQFADATFGIKRGWVEEFCDALTSERIKITWSCLTRVNLVDEAILQKMADAGCWNVLYGVESGCQELLDIIEKGITLKQAKDAIRWTKKTGIETTASFMFGLPKETPEMAKRTIEFAKKLNPDYAQFFLTKYYFDDGALDDYGTVSKDWDYSPYDFRGPIFVPDAYRDIEELKKIQRRAYREFYLRPSFLIKKMAGISSISELKRYAHGIKILFKMKRNRMWY